MAVAKLPRWLGAALLLGLLASPAAAFQAEVTVEDGAAGHPVNRLILGNNLQWVDRGDGVLAAAGDRFDPGLIATLRTLGPTMLRYPGGSQTAVYHWRDGVGALDRRGRGSHFYSHAVQPVLFGTDEFLDLCAKLGAAPLISVNVATGTAKEAADWVAYANAPRPAEPGSPRVRYWEIGNEPYLQEKDRPEIRLDPDEFARRANAFIPAMKAADPTIAVGIPLRSDRIGGVPATPYPGFNDRVLDALTVPFDFVAVHDAYAPFAFDRAYPERDLYLAVMAAPLQVAEDFALTRATLRRHLGGRTVPLAVTEYSALFTIGRSTDDAIASVAGALYVADLLRLFATTDDLLTADFWSLIGNWHFGAVTSDGRPRPVYRVLSAYSRALHGAVLPVRVTAPPIATPKVGFVAARSDVAAVTALAVRDGARVTVFALNKHPDEAAALTLRLGSGARIDHAGLETFGSEGMFAGRKGEAPPWHKAPIETGPDRVSATLPAHSLAIITLRVSPRESG